MIQPPDCVSSKYQIAGPSFPQFLKLHYCLPVIRWGDSEIVKEMPAFSLAVVQAGRISAICYNDKGVTRRNSPVFVGGCPLAALLIALTSSLREEPLRT